MTRPRRSPWRGEDWLETPEDIAASLEAVFAEGDGELITHALGAVARSRGMTELARRTGLGRRSLYKALSSEGQPEFATVLKVVRALGLKMIVTPERRKRSARRVVRKTGPKPRIPRRATPKAGKRLAKGMS